MGLRDNFSGTGTLACLSFAIDDKDYGAILATKSMPDAKITALMAQYLGPGAAEGFMHEFSGWVIFVVATILFLLLHSTITAVRKKLGWYDNGPGPQALAAKVAAGIVIRCRHKVPS